MIKHISLFLILCLIIMAAIITPLSTAGAQTATRDEALAVAGNWITVIIEKYGHWGGSPTAAVEGIEEFKDNEKILGYFCSITPKGFIVLSLRKELAPVKAYSARNNLEPDSEMGTAGLLKGRMKLLLQTIEEVSAQRQAKGRAKTTTSVDLSDVLEIDYRDAWEQLENDVEAFMAEPLLNAKQTSQPLDGDEDLPEWGIEAVTEKATKNYQEGEVLLTTAWHQGSPFNTLGPVGNTACPDCCPNNPWTCSTGANVRAGCVATAGAQIMKYWNWPPYGEGSHSYSWDNDDSCFDGTTVGGETLSADFSDTYDWPNMMDTVTDASPAAQRAAVAELSYEVAVALEMDFGICGSGIPTSSMEGVFENHYRYYSGGQVVRYENYTDLEWFDIMKYEFDANRPVQYRVDAHAIVGDGWQELGALPTRQIHLNYGWGRIGNNTDGDNTWYTLNAFHLGDIDNEYLIRYILPAPYLTSSLSGTYVRNASFPYRYFYKDASGAGVTFEGGQRLQFLHGIVVSGTGSSSEPVSFQDSSNNYTYLFTRGDLSRGVRINYNSNGAINLQNGGGIKFR